MTTLLGAIAHEFHHASDPEVNVNDSILFQLHSNLIAPQEQAAVAIEKARLIHSYIPEDYSSLRFESKMKLLEKLYDETACAQELTHIKPDISIEELRTRFRQNDYLTWYAAKYETPAIDFANDVVAYANQYRIEQEPQRINDYTDMVMPLPTEKLPKEDFAWYAMGVIEKIIDLGGIEQYEAMVKEATQAQILEYQQMIKDLSVPSIEVNDNVSSLVCWKDTPQNIVAEFEKHEKMMAMSEARTKF